LVVKKSLEGGLFGKPKNERKITPIFSIAKEFQQLSSY
jgi:hypothetical protein